MLHTFFWLRLSINDVFCHQYIVFHSLVSQKRCSSVPHSLNKLIWEYDHTPIKIVVFNISSCGSLEQIAYLLGTLWLFFTQLESPQALSIDLSFCSSFESWKSQFSFIYGWQTFESLPLEQTNQNMLKNVKFWEVIAEKKLGLRKKLRKYSENFWVQILKKRLLFYVWFLKRYENIDELRKWMKNKNCFLIIKVDLFRCDRAWHNKKLRSLLPLFISRVVYVLYKPYSPSP